MPGHPFDFFLDDNNMMNLDLSRATLAIAILAAAALSACGGGGGGDNSAPATPVALTLAAAPAIAPANGTTGADYAPTVQFTASKAMAAAGIKLVCDGVAVAGKTTVSGAVATFKPDAPGVAANAQCTATVDAAATKDAAGTVFTGSTALSSFAVKALACPGGTANTPPSFNGATLVAA